METIMSFDYDVILQKAPCFVLVKDLRYLNDDIEQKIDKGDIIAFSNELTPLFTELNRPSLNFTSANQLKRFLYKQGFFSDLESMHGNDLINQIESKNFSEIDSELNEHLSCDEILNFLFDHGKLKEWEIMYDIGGTAYHEKNSLRDFQVYNETFDIRFFGGKDTSILFDFVKVYFEKHQLGNDIHELLKEIRFDFFEMMDSFDGQKQIFPYDLWHDFLHFLNKENLIEKDIYEEYLQDTYF